MKKYLLLSLSLLCMSGMHAGVTLPAYSYSEDFSSQLPEGEMLPDGWVSYGLGEPVAADFEEYFGSEGEAPFYRVIRIEGTSAAWSCSTFKYAATADEWLVTPPIRISSDSEVVQLKAVGSGAYATNRYRVLISESGQEQEAFRPTPLLNTTLTGWETEVRSKDSYIALNGYAGKEICLAFVNRSEDAGMLGFTDIAIAPYTAEVVDMTPSVLPAGSPVDITLNVSLRTPQEVRRLKAELKYGDTTVTQYYDQTITINGTRVAVVFPGVVIPEGGMEYIVELTPDFEGAEPTLVTGEIGTPSTSYPPVAIIEEFTGTWCTYCPRGAAFMNYYADQFDGRDGGLKAIGIALHAVNDPMMMENPEYLNTAYAVSGCNGYPFAFFNRSQSGDPSDAHIVREIAAGRSNSRVDIKRVDYQPGQPIKVSYEVENSYSKKNMNQRVAIVMVENNVRGDNPLYNQTNGLSGVSQKAVENTYGVGLWPYFEFFATQPSTILYPDMVYDHVARGIWPDYYGTLLTEACEAEVAVPGYMMIDMPAQVMVPDNTAIIVMILDGDTGAVLTADEVHADLYNQDIPKDSGISQVGSETSPQMKVNGTELTITSDCSGRLDIFSADGVLLRCQDVAAGDSSISLADLRGLVILRLSGVSGQSAILRSILR